MIFDNAMFFQNPGNYFFPFRLYNHGSVPAVLVGWQGMVRLNGQNQMPVGPPSGAGLAVFPGRDVNLNFNNVQGPRAPTPVGAELEITVEYRAPSAPALAYRTRVIGAWAGAGVWNIQFPELT